MPAELDALLAGLEQGVGELVETDLAALVQLAGPSSGLHEVGRRVERIRRRLGAFDAHYVAAVETGDEPARHSSPSTVSFLRDQLKISPSEAKRRVALAHAITPEPSFSAAPLPPPCPTVAAALTAGAVSADQAQVILGALDALPEVSRKEHGPALEARLVDEARSFDSTMLARLARQALAHLDPDGILRDQDWQDRNRTAYLVANRDGTGTLRALLTTEGLEKLQTVLGPLAAPVPAGPDGPDPRSAGQRTHDALIQLADRALNAGDLPASGGTPTTVVIHITEEQLATRTGLAVSANGNLIPIQTALELAVDPLLYTLVTTAKQVPLWLGRTSRTATPGQTIALAARDGGCAFPGCDRPPAMCERHHIRGWAAHDGPTDIDNLLLFCGYHHRDHDKRGWVVVMIDGQPWFIPPTWVDPEQRPIRNTMHRPLVQ